MGTLRQQPVTGAWLVSLVASMLTWLVVWLLGCFCTMTHTYLPHCTSIVSKHGKHWKHPILPLPSVSFANLNTSPTLVGRTTHAFEAATASKARFWLMQMFLQCFANELTCSSFLKLSEAALEFIKCSNSAHMQLFSRTVHLWDSDDADLTWRKGNVG